MDEDNDRTQAEQRDAPGGEAAYEAKRSWVSVLAAEAHHVGDTLLDAAALYGAKLAVDKIRKPPDPSPPPTPPPGDGEA